MLSQPVFFPSSYGKGNIGEIFLFGEIIKIKFGGVDGRLVCYLPSDYPSTDFASH